MSEVLDLEPQPNLDTAAKRALIETELRADPSRSDRKIAEAIGHGICHKTVGAARASWHCFPAGEFGTVTKRHKPSRCDAQP